MRSHIRIVPGTETGPYYDAQNSMVTNGWLVEKQMDRFAHFDHSNTGNYQSFEDWCGGNIQIQSNIYSGHVDVSTLAPITTEQQAYFLVPTSTSNGVIYAAEDSLKCPFTDNSGADWPETESDVLLTYFPCFISTSSSPFVSPMGYWADCWTWVGFETLTGVNVRSINNGEGYSGSMHHSSNGLVTEEKGQFSTGLYQIDFFLSNGKVMPMYAELGKGISTEKEVEISIVPNVIINNTLRFGVTCSANSNGLILVQSLDGVTLYSEEISFEEETTVNRNIDVPSGHYPYNQLRVSVLLDNGVSFQGTAITE